MDRKARLLSSNKYIYLVERKNREAYLANKHTSKIPCNKIAQNDKLRRKKKNKNKNNDNDNNVKTLHVISTK